MESKELSSDLIQIEVLSERDRRLVVQTALSRQRGAQHDAMTKTKSLYHRHRFPSMVISHAVRWYFRFQLSLRDIEELLFEREVAVSYETIHR